MGMAPYEHTAIGRPNIIFGCFRWLVNIKISTELRPLLGSYENFYRDLQR
jgi:hypothetical protein